MNIIDICKKRNKCAICNDEMKLTIQDKLFVFKASLVDDFIVVRGVPIGKFNSRKELEYKFYSDGSYTHNKQTDMRSITIYSSCKTCAITSNLKADEQNYKINSLLKNLNKNVYGYSIELFLNPDSLVYDSHISYDTIKLIDNGSFYHINVDMYTKKTSIYQGKLEGTIADVFSLTLDKIVDLEKLSNAEEIKSKVQIYSLFS